MKKILIALLVLVVLVIAGFIGLMQVGKGEIEKQVTEGLKAQNITAESVKLNGIFGDSLVITKLKGVSPDTFVNYTVDEIVMKIPNPESFDPATTGYPLVAEETLMKNIAVTYTVNNTPTEIKLASMRVLEWKQNLGKVFQSKAPMFSEEFFAVNNDMYAKSVEIKDLELNIASPKQSTKTKNIVMENLTPQSVGSYMATGIEAISENPSLGTVVTKAASTSMGPMKMPPPAFWATMMSVSNKAGVLSSVDEEKVLKAFTDYIGAGVDFDAIVKGFTVDVQQGSQDVPGADIGEIGMKGKYDPTGSKSLSLTIALKDAKFDVAKLDTSPNGVMLHKGLLDGKEAHADFTFDTAINLDSKDSFVAMDFGVRGLGDTKSKVDFVLPWTSFEEAFKEIGGVTGLQKVMVKDVQLSYADLGLLPRGLVMAASQMKNSPEVAYEFLSKMVESESAALLQFTNQANVDALKNCVFNPGTLESKLALTKPTSLLELAGVGMQQPQSLPIQVLCKPGKNIVEAAKALTPQ